MVLPMISGQWPIVLVLVPLVHNSINRGDGHDQLITIYLSSHSFLIKPIYCKY